MAKKKHLIGIVIICGVGYIIFWWWLFGGKNIFVTGDDGEFIEKSTSQSNSHDVYESFSHDDFYIVIDTDDVQIGASIVEGVTDDDLKQGVGHHKTTSLPGEKGNVVLSGHRWRFGNNPNFTVFEDIDQLKNGDKVTVHYNEKSFVYEVFEQEVVDDDAIEILESTDEQVLTIYTCTPKYTALKRLVVRARLIEI